MLKIIRYLRSGLVVSVITAMSVGLSAGSVYAEDDDDEKEKEASSREVLVDCDKGQSVTKTLVQFANDTKPLEIIIKGNCVDNEDEVQIERNKVDLVGHEETGGAIPYMLVDGGRQIGIGGSLILAGGLQIGAGQVEIGSETEVTIEFGIIVGSQSLLRITTEGLEDENDVESAAGQVVVNGPIFVENHSLLEVQREVSDGIVLLNDIIASLQSSVDIKKATIGNIQLTQDSHVVFRGDVNPKDGDLANSISCDSESRVWEFNPDGIGDTDDFVLNSCLGN